MFRLFDADESGNIELDEMFEIVATFYDMEVKIFVTQGDGIFPWYEIFSSHRGVNIFEPTFKYK